VHSDNEWTTITDLCRFQEIAGAVETALYTPFAEATGLFFAFMCLVLIVDVVIVLLICYFTYGSTS